MTEDDPAKTTFASKGGIGIRPVLGSSSLATGEFIIAEKSESGLHSVAYSIGECSNIEMEYRLARIDLHPRKHLGIAMSLALRSLNQC